MPSVPPTERQIAVTLYEYENRIRYLEDQVQVLLETIHQYQHCFENLAGASAIVPCQDGADKN